MSGVIFEKEKIIRNYYIEINNLRLKLKQLKAKKPDKNERRIEVIKNNDNSNFVPILYN